MCFVLVDVVFGIGAIVVVHDVRRCSRNGGAHNQGNVSHYVVAAHGCIFVRRVVSVFKAYLAVGGCCLCDA